MEFGKRLRELRKERGITLETLASKIGSSKGYLSGIENEKVAPPTEKFVRKLARIFGLDEVAFLKMAYLDKIPRALQPELRKALGAEGSAAGVPPARHRPGEDSGILPCRIPLLNAALQGYPGRIDSRGLPEASGQHWISIPGVHPTQTFALTVCGDAMAADDGTGFKPGDIALASRSGRVESGDYVFAVFTEKGRPQGQLRQVMLQDGETVALQAANRDHPIIFLKRRDISGLFKVIGKIGLFTSPVAVNAEARPGGRAE